VQACNIEVCYVCVCMCVYMYVYICMCVCVYVRACVGAWDEYENGEEWYAHLRDQVEGLDLE
jgi:hypothetical protein